MPTTLDAPATAAPAANGNAVVHKGKRQPKAAQDSGPPPTATFPGLHEAFNSAIAVNMCGVDVVVRRPSGAVKIPGVKVMAITESGASEEVRKTTTPGFIIDEKGDHPLWGAIDDNQRKSKRSSRNTALTTHVGDSTCADEQDRQPSGGTSAPDVRNDWNSSASSSARKHGTRCWPICGKIPDHFHLLMPRMPTPTCSWKRFDVTWSLNPLTPINPAHLRFDELNAVDKQAIIDESNRMAQDLVKTRARRSTT